MRIDYQDLFDKAIRDGVNLFLGAGFAIEAKNVKNENIPLGAELAKELAAVFQTPKLDLSRVAAILESRQKDDFYNYLRDKFHVDNFNSSYYHLELLNLKGIYTTNIDNLIYKLFESSQRYFVNDTTQQGPSFRDKKAIDYYPLHGTIVNKEKPLVFTPMSIASSYSSSPKLWNDLLQSIERYPTIFWGYSLNDAGILEILNTIKVSIPERNQKWIVLHTDNADEEEYFKSVGFNIIVASNIELLNYFTKFDLPTKSTSKRKSVKEVFGEEFVPSSPHTLPVREINEFYLGAAPTWTDIYRPDLYKTSHFVTIQNSIFSKKNTIVIGIPGSGKSTLLMQLAAFTDFDGYKIILEFLTVEKVKNILYCLGNENALIFVDNFTEDIQSFLLFHNKPNIKLVGFDREHNFEIISHLVNRFEFSEISVTTLTPIDIQELYVRIPPVIKTKNLKTKAKEADDAPSLFEFINLNLNITNINDRYKSLIESLEKDNELLTDLLVLSCYIHYCRTPLSFDMALSYFSDDIGDYQDVYELRDKLGALLTNSPLSLIENNDQDYFSPRSTVLSEVIIELVSSDILRRVLYIFIDQLPPYKIVGYKTFRKRAHDKYIMLKAFPDWREGKKYYEKLMEFEPKNPFLLQQGALYLSYKQKYSEAFFWIDKARNMTNDAFLSIRNSHAIILFDANIKKEGVDVKVSLDKSMQILVDCYSEDKRKLYHAKKFAGQALEYYKRYGDERAHEYINRSLKWIQEELKTNYWDRGLNHLQKQLKQIAK